MFAVTGIELAFTGTLETISYSSVGLLWLVLIFPFTGRLERLAIRQPVRCDWGIDFPFTGSLETINNS